MVVTRKQVHDLAQAADLYSLKQGVVGSDRPTFDHGVLSVRLEESQRNLLTMCSYSPA